MLLITHVSEAAGGILLILLGHMALARRAVRAELLEPTPLLRLQLALLGTEVFLDTFEIVSALTLVLTLKGYGFPRGFLSDCGIFSCAGFLFIFGFLRFPCSGGRGSCS